MRAFPSNLLNVVFGIPLNSLYCNTVLANLNARAYIRGEAVISAAFDDTKADIQSGEVMSISPAHIVSLHDPSCCTVMNLGDDHCAGRTFRGGDIDLDRSTTLGSNV